MKHTETTIKTVRMENVYRAWTKAHKIILKSELVRIEAEGETETEAIKRLAKKRRELRNVSLPKSINPRKPEVNTHIEGNHIYRVSKLTTKHACVEFGISTCSRNPNFAKLHRRD